MTLNSKMMSHDPAKPSEYHKDAPNMYPFFATRISTMPSPSEGYRYRTVAQRVRVSYFEDSRLARIIPLFNAIFALFSPETDWQVTTYIFKE